MENRKTLLAIHIQTKQHKAKTEKKNKIWINNEIFEG